MSSCDDYSTYVELEKCYVTETARIVVTDRMSHNEMDPNNDEDDAILDELEAERQPLNNTTTTREAPQATSAPFLPCRASSPS